MTDVDISLSVRVIGELYGPLCSKICMHLLKEGELTIPLIKKSTHLPLEEIRRCLVVLLHNRVVSVVPGKITAYNCNVQNAITICFYKYYIKLVKKLYGDICELVVEELLFMGQMTYMHCVERTVKRYNAVVEPDEKLSVEKVKDKFTVLLREGIICQVVGNNSGGVMEANGGEQQNGSSSLGGKSSEDTTSIETIFEQTTRRKRFRRGGCLGDIPEQPKSGSLKAIGAEDPDLGLHYGASHSFLARLFAEDYLVNLASEYFDPGAGRVLSAMFRTARKRLNRQQVPQPGWGGLPPVAAFIDDASFNKLAMSPNEIVKEVNAKSASATVSTATTTQTEIPLVTVQLYLSLLTGKYGPVKFITKVGENTFACDLQQAFKGVCQRNIENVVEFRFGIKSLRIFRLILSSEFCDQKQMEQAVLMPVKECRERLYTLMTNGFIVVREGVSAAGAPATTSYAARFGTGRSSAVTAYTVEMDRLSRMLLEWAKKAILNCIVRREFEVLSNKRVIDREKRVLDLLASMEENEPSVEDKAALEEMLPPAERVQAANIRKAVFKLESAECQLVESLFVFEIAARLHKYHPF